MVKADQKPKNVRSKRSSLGVFCLLNRNTRGRLIARVSKNRRHIKNSLGKGQVKQQDSFLAIEDHILNGEVGNRRQKSVPAAETDLPVQVSNGHCVKRNRSASKRIIVESTEVNSRFPIDIQAVSVFRRIYLGRKNKFPGYCCRYVESLADAQLLIDGGRVIDDVIVVGGNLNADLFAQVKKLFKRMGSNVNASDYRSYVVRSCSSVENKLEIGWMKHYVINAVVGDNKRQKLITFLEERSCQFTVGCWALIRFATLQ